MAVVNTDSPIITLTTDFGLKDNYVGIVKGIISGINPKAKIIDISNFVPPFDIEAGRYLLETSHNNFSPGTIHLAIVDPGVGSSRKALLLETEQYFFIGPDNGLFSFVPKSQIKRVISINQKKYFMKDVSSTFHGRDIFAPVAAYLSLGVSPEEFGRGIRSIVRQKQIGIRKIKKGTVGRVIYIDHFGNLVTSFKKDDLPLEQFSVYLDNRKIGRLQKTFGSVKKNQPICYINSFGYLEIGLNQGSAAEFFKVDYSSDAQILIAPS